MKAAFLSALFGLALLLPGSAAAVTFNFNDPQGLDDGGACETGTPSCALNENFDVGPVVGEFGLATGSITWVANQASINITVPSVTFVGSFDGVEEVVFTNVTYSVSNWFALDFGGTITGLGSQSGTVSGTYEQFDGGGASVSGPTAFSEAVNFSNLLCTNNVPSAVCGFQVGTLLDFNLDVGAVTPSSHSFTHTFNVAAPEPGTAILVGLGLFGLAQQRRRRN